MPEVQGPDGQRYQFPEGTSPDVMKAAMAKRYPKKSSAPTLADGLGVKMPSQEQFQELHAGAVARDAEYEQQLSQRGAKRRSALERDPENIGWSSPKSDAQLGATQYGKSDGAFLGFGDEVVGLFNPEEGKRRSELKDYARRAYPDDFAGGEVHGAAVNAIATLPIAGPKALQAASYAPKALQPTVAGAQSGFLWDATHQMGTSTGDLGERVQDFDTGRSALSTGVGAAGGAVLQGAAGLLSRGDQESLIAAAAADISAIDSGSIRPQSLKAFNRLLSKSGLSDADIAATHAEVSNRLSGVQGLPAGSEARKRTFQHYMEVLAEDEGGALYHPQAAANILMTVQERANSALPGDASRSIVGSAVKADRASQVPFLEGSAQSISQGTRAGTNELVQNTRTDLGSQYEAALDPSQIAPQAQQEAMQMIESIRPFLDGPSGLKVQAAAEGVDVDGLIAQNPMKALHWIQSAARRKAQSADPNRAAYASLRQRALPVIENNVPQYGQLRRDYASNEGIDKAKTFGDRLFGGAQSNMMNNPGMRAEMVAEFQALTDTEKQIALVSIRDQALGKIAGGSEGAPARLSQLNTRNALDFLEQVGQKGFADDIRAIGRENQLLSVADAGNPLRQSATFSNAQARAEAPALYNSTVANAVDNSTPGTMLGEGMLMAFAPHYQGAYAAYRGGRMAAAAGLGTRKKTLEDMTRFMMSRPDEVPSNAFAQAPQQTPAPQVANAFAPSADGGYSTKDKALDATALGLVAAGTAGSADAQQVSELENAQGRVAYIENEQIRPLEADLQMLNDPEADPRALQEILKRRVNPELKIDGVVGPQTLSAINELRGGIQAELEAQRGELEKAQGLLTQAQQRQVYAENQTPGWLQTAQDQAPLVGTGLGLLIGMRGRGGAVKKSRLTAKATEERANAFLNDNPIAPKSITGPNSINERAPNINEFWRMGGAGENVPFKTKNDGTWVPRANAMEPSNLYQPNKNPFRTSDVGWMAGGLGEAALSTQYLEESKAALKEAREDAERYQQSGDIAAYEDAIARVRQKENEVAIFTTLQRVGLATAGGRLMGSLKSPYASARPNVRGAEMEQGLVRQGIKKKNTKPPESASPN